MTNYRTYWDEELETMPRDKLKAYQFDLLKNNLELVYHKSPYYKKLFQKAGVAPFHLESIEDLKKFPTIDKKVLRSQQELYPDFGDLTCAPEDGICFSERIQRFNRCPHSVPVYGQETLRRSRIARRVFSGLRVCVPRTAIAMP